jgi:hypothetical protein
MNQNTMFEKQTVTYKTNFILETITILFLVALFVFSYPKTVHAHHTSYHDSGSSHQFNVVDALKNKEIVFMALGTAVYYQDNCAGLTNRGKRYLNRAIEIHNINTNIMHEHAQYQIGYKLAESYPSCGKLRFAITDAGLGAMIR